MTNQVDWSQLSAHGPGLSLTICQILQDWANVPGNEEGLSVSKAVSLRFDRKKNASAFNDICRSIRHQLKHIPADGSKGNTRYWHPDTIRQEIEDDPLLTMRIQVAHDLTSMILSLPSGDNHRDLKTVVRFLKREINVRTVRVLVDLIEALKENKSDPLADELRSLPAELRQEAVDMVFGHSQQVTSSEALEPIVETETETLRAVEREIADDTPVISISDDPSPMPVPSSDQRKSGRPIFKKFRGLGVKTLALTLVTCVFVFGVTAAWNHGYDRIIAVWEMDPKQAFEMVTQSPAKGRGHYSAAGYFYLRNMEHDKAKEVAHDIIGDRLAETKEVARAYALLGLISSQIGETQSASAYNKLSEDYYRNANSLRGIAYARISESMNLAFSDNPERALGMIAKVNPENPVVDKWSYYKTAAVTHLMTNRHQKALRFLRELDQHNLSDRQRAEVYALSSYAHVISGATPRAMEYANKADALQAKTGDPRLRYQNLINYTLIGYAQNLDIQISLNELERWLLENNDRILRKTLDKGLSQVSNTI